MQASQGNGDRRTGELPPTLTGSELLGCQGADGNLSRPLTAPMVGDRTRSDLPGVCKWQWLLQASLGKGLGIWHPECTLGEDKIVWTPLLKGGGLIVSEGCTEQDLWGPHSGKGVLGTRSATFPGELGFRLGQHQNHTLIKGPFQGKIRENTSLAFALLEVPTEWLASIPRIQTSAVSPLSVT